MSKYIQGQTSLIILIFVIAVLGIWLCLVQVQHIFLSLLDYSTLNASGLLFIYGIGITGFTYVIYVIISMVIDDCDS